MPGRNNSGLSRRLCQRQPARAVIAHARHGMVTRKLVGQIDVLVTEMYGAAHQPLCRCQRWSLGDDAMSKVDDSLVAPRHMLALFHDIQADLQLFGRQLAMDIAARAIELRLACGQA